MPEFECQSWSVAGLSEQAWTLLLLLAAGYLLARTGLAG